MIVSKNGISVKEITNETTLYARYDEGSVFDITGTVLYGISPTAGYYDVSTLNIPSEITEIAEGAFEENTDITELIIGGEAAQAASFASASALEKIGDRAFAGCSSLETITFALKTSLKSIGIEAFKGCSLITELVIPEGVNEIKVGALHNLSSLKHLVLPSNYSYVEGSNLSSDQKDDGCVLLIGCTSLETIECNSEWLEGGSGSSDTFSGLDMLYGYIEINSGGGWRYNLVPSTLTNIKINGGTSIHNYAFYGETITSLTLCDSIVTISSRAFDNCTGLTYTTYDNCNYLSLNGNPYYALMSIIDNEDVYFEINSRTRIIAGNAFYNLGAGGREYSIVIPNSVIGYQ